MINFSKMIVNNQFSIKRILFITLSFISLINAQNPLSNFLPPVDGVYAGNADLITVVYTDTIDDCANLCLNYTGPSYSNLGW